MYLTPQHDQKRTLRHGMPAHTIGTSLLAATLAFSSAFAEGSETGVEEEIYVLEDFEVRAQFLYKDQVNALKTPTPILDVPQSLSITTADEIALRGFDSVGDIVDYTPGVNNGQGEGHRDAVVFRGVRSTADFFVDGMRDDLQYYRPLYNVEQLEILRGPNALLFGRGGTGGILNRVMKKGVIGEHFNEYQISVDTFGAYSAQIDSNLTIDENAAFRVNAFYESLDNHRDGYDGERFGVSPTAHFKLGEKTRVDVSYEYNDNERFVDRGIPTGGDGKPASELSEIFFGDRDEADATFEAHVLRAALQHRFSDELKGRLDLAYGDYEKHYANFYATAYNEGAEEVTLSGYEDGTARESITVAGGLIGDFETGSIGHTVIAGAEYITSKNDNFRNRPASDTTLSLDALGGFSGTFPSFGDRTEADLDVVSLFLQDEIALTDSLDLVLGLRFDRIDFEVDVFDNVGDSTKQNQVDEEITPRLGLVYKPKENVSLYASYSQSFLPKSGEQYASVSATNSNLDPNEYTNLEAGIKWDFNPRMSFTAAIFEAQEDVTISTGGGSTEEQEAEIQGFEAQLQGQITNDWFIVAGYGYLTGEEESGNRPRELPKHSFSIWNKYHLGDKFAVGLGAVYQDKTYIQDDRDTELPSFLRVDAAAYYQINENLRLQVNIENLFDEAYYPHAHSDHQVTVGAPIHARFALTGRF
ncbi:MAG: TonB-dependent receptor [Opitutales bacterium]